MPDLPTLELWLHDARQQVRNLQVMQMRPNQPAEKLKVLSDLERSARAMVKLRLTALEYHKGLAAYLMTPEQHRAHARLLRLKNPNSRAADLHDAAATLKQVKHRRTARPKWRQ